MNMLRADASDAQIDWMIQNKDLNRFFKPTTSPEIKRKIYTKNGEKLLRISDEVRKSKENIAPSGLRASKEGLNRSKDSSSRSIR